MSALDDEETKIIKKIFRRPAQDAEPASAHKPETPASRRKLLLFVHGFCGGEATWGMLPEFLRNDLEISSRYDIDEYKYPTTFWLRGFLGKHQKIQALARGLATAIDNFSQSEVVLCCHSMGGVIARRYISEFAKKKVPLKVKEIILIAVPNNGSGLANIGKFLNFRNWQVRQLAKESDCLASINEDWRVFKLNEIVKCHIVIGGNDTIVSEESALCCFEELRPQTISNADHITVVKPDRDRMMIVKVIKKILLEK